MYGASADSSATAVVTAPDPFSNCSEQFDAFGCWDCGEQGVHASKGFDEVSPMVPIALPLTVIRRHDPSVDASPLSSEQTREMSLSLNRKTRQELFCRGKVEENNCKNSVSDIWKVLSVTEWQLKVRDAISAILLSVPVMETDTRGEASLT